MPFQLETAGFRDLNALRTLEKICFPKDAWTLVELIAVLTLPDIVRIKAVADGQMVGFIAGDPHRSQGFSWIATVGVLPEWRHQGIGKALMAACEAQLPTPRIRLTVRQSNRAAIKLYEQIGYQSVTFWPRYYKDGESALVMEKMNPNAL